MVTRKTLEDGKVLKVLVDNFLNNRNEKTLLPFLSCLRDSIVWVPVTPYFSERDEEQLLSHLEVGYEFKTEDPIRMKPDILEAPDGDKWFPIFSSEDEVVGEYKDLHFSYVPIRTLDCLNMAHNYESDGVKGIVLDAFTRGLNIPFEISDIMRNLPSNVKEDEECLEQ